MSASTIGSINLLPEHEKREIYRRIVPHELLDRFKLSPYLVDIQGRSLLTLNCNPGSTSAEMSLYHEYSFPDPILYGQLTDTLNGQIHVLLYILNDPESPRFDVDRMPDGTPTKFGTLHRNLDAEQAALEAGLAPGQVRRGLRLLPAAIAAFEQFVESLGHDMYFVEPLYYHNAIIFERYGFAYQMGRKLMERIQTGFSEGGDLLSRLDNSTPFRQAGTANSIRLRSWAIHDGILGEPFTNVTMYKQVGKSAGISTCTDCAW
ncbi:MAG: hypothetical protein GXP40_11935 [Chloroflexi bacterium]|nr:hypothetical protein [Chloroflexota bacterium]